VSVVLVVDDFPPDLALAATVLGHAGHTVLEADCGETALTVARREHPDLIITDLLMPEMNGYELVREVRDDPTLRDTAVIFSTAVYSQEEVRRIAQACGVTHFLPKPCDPSTMVDVVSEVLGLDRGRVAPIRGADFETERRRLVDGKLVQKIQELDAVDRERIELVDQLLRAHEDERRRLAEQLHDDPIQADVAVGMRLQMLLRRIEDPEIRAAGQRLQETIQAATDRLRAMVFALAPVELEEQGLSVALRMFLANLTAGEPLVATLDDRTAREAPNATRTLLYRMAQEALSNVRKHAKAANVAVTLSEFDGRFSVRISDDGRGFDPYEALRVRPGHLGLAAMQERISTAGGTLSLTSAPGAGATVEITLPATLGVRARTEEG
jgi:signal transduction histidine kinase